jgi:hypothetical protein
MTLALNLGQGIDVDATDIDDNSDPGAKPEETHGTLNPSNETELVTYSDSPLSSPPPPPKLHPFFDCKTYVQKSNISDTNLPAKLKSSGKMQPSLKDNKDHTKSVSKKRKRGRSPSPIHQERVKKQPCKQQLDLPQGPITGGTSKSATQARTQQALVAAGQYVVSETRWRKFERDVREIDEGAHVDKSRLCYVFHSICQEWIPVQTVYSIKRFKDHHEEHACRPPEHHLSSSVATLQRFNVSFQPLSEECNDILKVCCGMTVAFDKRVGYYLKYSGSDGGGAQHKRVYTKALFHPLTYSLLSPSQKETVRLAQVHGRTWRSDRSLIAVFSVDCKGRFKTSREKLDSDEPCPLCLTVYYSRSFQTALEKD